MSIVNITHHDESVFDWEYKEKPKIQKSKLYRSKYRENIIKSAQINKQVDYNLIDSSRSLKSALLTSSKNNFLKRPQSLGYSKILLRAPCNFLKKDEGIHIRKIPHHKCIKSEYKPKLPNWKNQQQQQQQIPKSNGNNNNKEKNFKLQNIQNIKNIKPKGTIVPKYVDKERGDIHELRKSGIIPEYVYNKNFGKIPIYIMKRKQNYLLKSDEKIEKKDLENDQFGLNEILQINSSKLKIINPKERTEILNGLKKKWEELQKLYQRLPLCIDTEHKKQRKTKIEDELRNLEKDILLIESNPVIYVCDDDDENKQSE